MLVKEGYKKLCNAVFLACERHYDIRNVRVLFVESEGVGEDCQEVGCED